MFLRTTSRLKYFLFWNWIQFMWVHPPDNTINMKVVHEALQHPISSSLINPCYTDPAHIQATLRNTSWFMPKHPKVPVCYKCHTANEYTYIARYYLRLFNIIRPGWKVRRVETWLFFHYLTSYFTKSTQEISTNKIIHWYLLTRNIHRKHHPLHSDKPVFTISKSDKILKRTKQPTAWHPWEELVSEKGFASWSPQRRNYHHHFT